MFAFLSFGPEETTILLFFGCLVFVPLIAGVVALAVDFRTNRRNHPG